MIRVLIVDDERYVRYSIKKLGKWDEMGAEIIGEASNGKEAYELTCQLNPQIIVTDMKMPGINGIEFLGMLKGNFNDIKIIILSGYDDFEYMKCGIENRVVDYILKPINKEQLNNSITKAIVEIRVDQQKREQDILKNIQIKSADILLRDKCFNELISGSNNINPTTLKNLYTNQLINNETEYAVCIFLIEINAECLKKYENDREIIDYLITNIIEESLLCAGSIMFKSYMHSSEICTVMPKEKGNNETSQGVSFLRMCLNVISNIQKYLGLNVVAGISNIRKGVEQINLSYYEGREAALKVNILSGEKVGFYNSLSVENYKKGLILDENEFILSVIRGNINPIKVILDKLFMQTILIRTLCIEDIIRLYEDIIFISEKCVIKIDPIICPKNKSKDGINDLVNSVLQDMKEFTVVKHFLLERITQYVRAVSNNNKIKYKSILYIIKDYIDNYYMEEISLSSLAKRFYLSSSYLCRIFKEEFDQNITDYLIKVRISKAKKYIQEGNYKVTDIMVLTGFKNLNYFGKVYKKHFGIAPSQDNCQSSSSG